MPQRWKLTLEYDGRPFCGWQRQENALTVQQVVEEALTRFDGAAVPVAVAGRTDAGVHALGQVISADLSRDATPDRVREAVNFHLKPHPVAVVDVQAVPADFHARFWAQDRSYRYVIINRRPPLTVDEGLAWRVGAPLDIQAMQMAANLLIGQHDFSTFRAAHCQASSPVKTLDRLDISRQGERIEIKARARSFLYHQVRNMVGTLALVGMGRWTQDAFAAAFAACDRRLGGPTAPPDGLYFTKVRYPAS